MKRRMQTESRKKMKDADLNYKKEEISCFQCKKRLRVTNNYECKCGDIFCAAHRFCDQHNCAYDYVKENMEKLNRENPRIVKEKVERL